MQARDLVLPFMFKSDSKIVQKVLDNLQTAKLRHQKSLVQHTKSNVEHKIEHDNRCKYGHGGSQEEDCRGRREWLPGFANMQILGRKRMGRSIVKVDLKHFLYTLHTKCYAAGLVNLPGLQ